MSERHRALMQHYDGEVSLDAAELGDDDREVLAALGQLGDCVRVWADEQSLEVDVADAVMARLDERPALRALPGGGAPAPSPLASSAAPGGSTRSAWGWALGAAAAAALLIRLVTSESATTEPLLVAAAPATPTHQPAAVLEEGQEPDPAAEIESIEFGASGGAIFLVSAGTENTPVVWLSDDGLEGDVRKHPL